MANTTDRLYLLQAHMNYKVVSSKQDFYADTLNVLNKCLSLPNTGCCRRMSLRYFTQRGSKSLLLLPTAEKQQTHLGGTELLGMVCTIINLSLAPTPWATPRKKHQTSRQKMTLLMLLSAFHLQGEEKQLLSMKNVCQSTRRPATLQMLPQTAEQPSLATVNKAKLLWEKSQK